MSRRAAVELERIHPLSRAEWRQWLEANHSRRESVWLTFFKKAAAKPSLSIDDIVEEALCYGWIDSLPRKLDAERSMLLVSPRRPGSSWSKINKERAEKMIAAGLMADPGLNKIEAARRDGSWDRLNEVDALSAPHDLAAAFRLHPTAAERFAAFPPSARRGILEWIASARTPQTRARRIEETARLAAQGLRANQWPRPKERSRRGTPSRAAEP